MIVKRMGIIFLAGIILCSALFRLYNIKERTEFLADQGSAIITVFDAWKNGHMLLTGPRTSSGQYPGPAYYYLIAPWVIADGFRPLVPAIVFAFLGVISSLLLYIIVQPIAGTLSALAAAALWGMSGTLVSWDRRMWNPTLIPFFIFCLFYILRSIWRIEIKAIAIGIICSILIQLHPTGIYITGCIVLYALLYWTVHKQIVQHIKPILLFLIAFIIPQLPYIFYESTVRFTDIKGLIKSLFGSNSVNSFSLSINHYPWVIADSIWKPFLPLPYGISGIIGLCILALSLLLTGWTFWIGLFEIAVIASMMFTKSDLHLHYVMFLIPSSVIVTSIVLGKLKNIIIKYILLISLVLFVSLHGIYAWYTDPGLYDIDRIERTNDLIKNKLVQKPFAFTILGSKSFSDYHYRYIFTRDSLPIRTVKDSFDRFLIICESTICPQDDEMISKKSVQTICYDHFCGLDYPAVDLSSMHYFGSISTHYSRVYVYEK